MNAKNPKLNWNIAFLLIVTFSILLTIIYSPKKETQLSLEKLNNLEQKVDQKLSPEVKEQLIESVIEKKEKISVVVKATDDVRREVAKSKGKIEYEAQLEELKYIEIELPIEKVIELAKEDEVVKIYPVVIYYPTLDESVPLVNARTFWDSGYKGNGIKVAVIDTGIDKAHPMLQGKVINEKDFSDSGTPQDRNGHGTHVAGIVAGTIANGGLYSGVAPEAQLLNAKVFSDSTGQGRNSWLIDAIGWAIQNNADVISMSLGSPAADPAVENAIKAAVDNGIVVIASSGNCGSGCPSSTCGSFRGVTSPGSSPNVISVGAVDKNKQVACFSSGENIQGIGIKPDIVAPGVDIKSSIPNGAYGSKQGTSMSAPHVSGAVALLLQRNPNLTNADVKFILEETSIDLGSIGKDTSYGSGMLDLSNALNFYSDLEFQVNFEQQVEINQPQHIEVQIFDDIPIVEVNGKIVKPDNSEITFIFNKITANIYSYDYSDTANLGDYRIDVQITYQPSLSSSSSDVGTKTAFFLDIFRVALPSGDFGNVEAIDIPKQQFLSRNLTGSIIFSNTASFDFNISILIQLLINDSEQNIAREIRLPSTITTAHSLSQVQINEPLNVGQGNYTIRILTDYGSGSIVNNTNINITDDMPPKILNISYNKELSENNPQIFVMSLDEYTSLANISLALYDYAFDGSLPVDYTTKLILENGRRKEASATIWHGIKPEQYYTALIEVCDIYGNCANSSNLMFNISSCNDEHLLIIKTYNEKSIFEEIASQNNICLSILEKTITDTPPSSYLENFDAVIWSAKTDLVNINDEDVEVLTDYHNKKGRLLVEGSDIAFKHNKDNFMHSVLHAELKGDIGFSLTSSEQLNNLSINLARIHLLLQNLQSPLQFNSTIDPFPDSVMAYNGSAGLASWNGVAEGSAMIAYEDGQRRTLFLPFSITALDETAKDIFISNSINWLLENVSLDIKPIRLEHDILFEGEVNKTIVIYANEQIQNDIMLQIFVDENKIVERTIIPFSNEYAYPYTTSLSVGKHIVKVVVNNDFSVREINYINNIREYNLTVYPSQPDLLISGFSYRYDEALQAILLNVNVSNLGGTAATTLLKAYLENDNVAEQNLKFDKGETKSVNLSLNSQKGIYKLTIVADSNNSVVEYNESNNELNSTIFLCSKEKVLVVDDNDAEFYSTENPSSANEFVNILKNDGYCVDYFNQQEQGLNSSEYLPNFQLVIWSAGDYFNGVINEEDAIAILNYSGNLLIEGADIGLDHSNDTLLRRLIGAEFRNDILLGNTTSLILNLHNITVNISRFGLSITKKSPFPDSLDAIESDIVAEWPDGSAAIIATKFNKSKESKKKAYYGFSVDGISDNSSRDTLVLDTVAWLLEMPNNPPQIHNLANVTANEGENIAVLINATDSDGDALAYDVTGLPFGASFDNATSTITWLTDFDDSGNHTININISDGIDYISGSIIITVNNANRAPILAFMPNMTQNENTTIVIIANATDLDNENSVSNDDNILIFKINDSRFTKNNNIFEFNAGFDDAGMFAVTVSIDDGELVDTQEVNIKILNVNRQPRITSLPITNATEEQLYMYDIGADDDDIATKTGDNITFALLESPSGIIIDAASGSITWTPTNGQAEGSHNIKIQVSDFEGLNDNQTFAITVANVNDPPIIISALPPNITQEQVLFTYDVNADDDDFSTLNPSEVHTYYLDAAPDGMSIDSATGLIEWVPTTEQAFNSYDVTVKVTDIARAFDVQDISIFVEDTTPPAITIISAPLGFINTDGIIVFEVLELHDNNPIINIIPNTTYRRISFENNKSIYVANYTNEGYYTYTITATDQSSNTGAYVSEIFTIDKTAPATNDDADTLWHTEDITINLNSNDPISGSVSSGIKDTYYTVYNDGVPQSINILSSAPIIIDYEDDDNWIEYWSVDRAGNEEVHKFATDIKLDKTPPLIYLELEPLLPEYPNIEPLPITLYVNDPVIDGTPSDNVNTTILLDNEIVDDVNNLNVTFLLGTHEITVTSLDIAGNQYERTITFTVFLQLTEEQMFITPESLQINNGVMTAHIKFPGLYNASQIFNFTLDDAPYDHADGNQEQQLNVHFRREAVAGAIEARNEILDTYFFLEGWAYYNGQIVKVVGSEDIMKIIVDELTPETNSANDSEEGKNSKRKS